MGRQTRIIGHFRLLAQNIETLITILKGIISLGRLGEVNDHFDRIDLPTPANSAEDDYLRLSTG